MAVHGELHGDARVLLSLGRAEEGCQYQGTIRATAWAAIASSRPREPAPSFVVALIPTALSGRDRSPAMAARMAGMKGAILGCSAMSVTSTFEGLRPAVTSRS